MSFKDLLLALTTYPEPTPASALDDAIDLAAALGARISAIACEVKIRTPSSPLGNYFLDIPAMVAAEGKKSATNAQRLLAAFQDAAEKRGIFQERISEQCLTFEVPELLIEYSRLRDLTIVPEPEGATSINGTQNPSSSALGAQRSYCHMPESEPGHLHSTP